jgi:hypothetical protein
MQLGFGKYKNCVRRQQVYSHVFYVMTKAEPDYKICFNKQNEQENNKKKKKKIHYVRNFFYFGYIINK